MANTRGYRTPDELAFPDVPEWMDRLAQDVAADVDGLEVLTEAATTVTINATAAATAAQLATTEARTATQSAVEAVAALGATYAAQVLADAEAATDAANAAAAGALAPTDQAVNTVLTNPASQASAALRATLAARDANNILDYGVTRSTLSSRTEAIKAALDSKPGEAFYFPPGEYRLDTGLVISKDNSLILAEGAHLYAGAAMDTLITYARSASGFTEDRALTGGNIDGKLLAKRLLSISKVIRFTLTRTTFVDGINRGLVTEAGLGAELFAYDLRFHNTTATNVVDNVAIEAKMGDSHYRDIIIRDWTIACKDTSANRWDRVHPWISQDTQANPQLTNRYPTSVAFDLTGSSDLQACVTDTYRYAYALRSNGTAYTAPARLLNCRAMWAADPILTTAQAQAYPAYVLDNTAGVGVISDRLTVTGHPTAGTTHYLTGPSTNVTTRNTFSYGFVKGAQGTTNDLMDYRAGVQQGMTTFVPTVYGSTGAGVHTYTTQTARMVVSGDTVTYIIRVRGTFDASTNFAGALRVGGIPLPGGATSVRDGMGPIGYAVGVNCQSAVIFANPAPYVSIMTNQGALGVQEADIPALGLRGKVFDLMFSVTCTHIKA